MLDLNLGPYLNHSILHTHFVSSLISLFFCHCRLQSGIGTMTALTDAGPTNMTGKHMPTVPHTFFGPSSSQPVFICKARQVDKTNDCILFCLKHFQRLGPHSGFWNFTQEKDLCFNPSNPQNAQCEVMNWKRKSGHASAWCFLSANDAFVFGPKK